MKVRVVFAILLAVSVLSACWAAPQAISPVKGSGHSINEWREVKGITSVSLGTIGDLTIHLGSEESLRVEGEDNILPYIVTKVVGGELRIETKPNTNISPTMPVRYDLTVKDLNSIDVGSVGSVSVVSTDLFNTQRFSIKVASVGNVSLTWLRADSLDVQISSVGNVEIMNGQVMHQKINISSTGSYKGGNVRSKTAQVDISSVGSATVWVDEELDVKITSVGSVQYYGRPRVTSSITSVGKVISLGDK